MAVTLLVRLEQPPGQFGHRVKVSHAGHRLPRAEAAQEQHFGTVHVADAGQISLVEQRLADGALRFGAQPPHRLGAIPVRAEQIGSQVAGTRDSSLVRISSTTPS